MRMRTQSGRKNVACVGSSLQTPKMFGRKNWKGKHLGNIRVNTKAILLKWVVTERQASCDIS